MPEYIEREEMLEDLRLQFCKGCNSYSEIKCRSCSVDDVIGFIEDVPTADVVEVVRCKDCKHCEFDEWDSEILCGCLHPSGLNDVSPNAFCSYGEKRSEGK